MRLQPPAVLPDERVLYHRAGHGGRQEHRRPGPQDDGGEQVIGTAAGEAGHHGRGRGRHEHEVGTLEAGKRADLVVLSTDPTALAPEELDCLTVERTVCGGSDVYLRTAESPKP